MTSGDSWVPRMLMLFQAIAVTVADTKPAFVSDSFSKRFTWTNSGSSGEEAEIQQAEVRGQVPPLLSHGVELTSGSLHGTALEFPTVTRQRAGPQPCRPVVQVGGWAGRGPHCSGVRPACCLARVPSLQGPWPGLLLLWTSSFHNGGPGFYTDCSIITRAFLTSLWRRESSHRQGG